MAMVIDIADCVNSRPRVSAQQAYRFDRGVMSHPGGTYGALCGAAQPCANITRRFGNDKGRKGQLGALGFDRKTLTAERMANSRLG
jgi:hypothetical protein